jgi:hypothetical protein
MLATWNLLHLQSVAECVRNCRRNSGNDIASTLSICAESVMLLSVQTDSSLHTSETSAAMTCFGNAKSLRSRPRVVAMSCAGQLKTSFETGVVARMLESQC